MILTQRQRGTEEAEETLSLSDKLLCLELYCRAPESVLDARAHAPKGEARRGGRRRRRQSRPQGPARGIEGRRALKVQSGTWEASQ